MFSNVPLLPLVTAVLDAVPQRQPREDDPRRSGCRQPRAERLDLEITESTLLEDRGDTRRALQALRARGSRISLDDFGTGYSSLSYLLSFPLDRIKIDRTFTMGLGVQERASVLVESVAAMSRRLGMCVLIEGVETVKQLRMIETLGTIAEAQGFLFSPPVPESGVLSLLRRDFGDQAA